MWCAIRNPLIIPPVDKAPWDISFLYFFFVSLLYRRSDNNLILVSLINEFLWETSFDATRVYSQLISRRF